MPTRHRDAKWAHMTFSPRRHAHFQTRVFLTCFVVFGDPSWLALSRHPRFTRMCFAQWRRAVFRNTGLECLFENSAFRHDLRSFGHLLEGLGPHASDPGSPKWLPQAPFKAARTSERTVVIGARPVPLLPQNGVLPARRAIFNNVSLHVFVVFGDPS